jgi:hypothetical protein
MMLVENLPIRLGQLVSVVEEDGKKLPFRIASIR